MLPLVIVGAPVVVITAVLYLTLTHPDGLTGPSYHRAKKSILAPFVRRGRGNRRGTPAGAGSGGCGEGDEAALHGGLQAVDHQAGGRLRDAG